MGATGILPSLLHTSSLFFDPEGRSESSPAIHRRVREEQYVFRPVGTIERPPRNAEFARPYGTQTTIIVHVPSSELLGYYQASLRDGARRIHLCRTTRALPWAIELEPFGLGSWAERGVQAGAGRVSV